MPARPTGSVTFLFTDIEGSTRLWERDEALAREAVARHDAALRAAIEARGGYVFKTVGDAFCAAFQTADAALAAAVASQRAISTAGAFPFRVRMGLHTGTAHERDEDYFGPCVNRVARVQSLACGGQILVSAATEALVRDALPPGLALRDLGDHRLKDLQRAERLHQVVGDGLPDGFPPLLGIDAVPNNLPLQLTSFLGREREVEAVRKALAAGRLVTLTGAGGSGKSRLALQVAAEALGDYPGGAWLVELAPVRDPADVPQAVATALRVREESGRPLLETILDALRARKTLVLLDNCEHLLGAAASLVETILSACPGVRVLATSREALSAAGETAWLVPSLALPPADATAVTPGGSPAVALFLDRASAASAAFRARPEDLTAIAEICRRLDGIPLAIELAAARASALSPRQIAEKLNDRFRLLTGGRRTALPRQQTLKAAIDWGHDLLPQPERVVLRRLAAFVGGFDLEGAETVCEGPAPEASVDRYDVLDLVGSLVAKSFVAVEEGGGGGVRYRLLETVRQYALDRLLEAGEGPATRDRHRDFVRALTERLQAELQGPGLVAAMERLDAEDGNVRAALEGCADEPEGVAAGLAIASAVLRHTTIRGHLADGRAALDALLARAGGDLDPALRARATKAAAVLAFHAGDYAAAAPLYGQALAIARDLHDEAGVADAEAGLAKVAFRRREFDEALRLGQRALAEFRRMGDTLGAANALVALGIVHADRGDSAAARACYEEGMPLLLRAGDPMTIAAVLGNLGYMAYREGNLPEARRLLEQQLAAFRTLRDRTMLSNALNTYGAVLDACGDAAAARTAFEESLTLRESLGLRALAGATLGNLATLACAEKDFDKARAYFVRNLDIAKESHDAWPRARAIARFADLETAAGRPERAVRLIAAAEAATGADRLSPSAGERAAFDALRADLRKALGDEAYDAARAAGLALTLDQAEALAREP